MEKIVALIFAAVVLNGCVSTKAFLEKVKGSSTLEVEQYRSSALKKVFDYDYNTCYEKTDKLLAQMPNVLVYHRDPDLIALYYSDKASTTSAGVFFTKIDATHTQVEISSAAMLVKEWIAKNVFSETVIKVTSEDNKLFKSQGKHGSTLGENR